MHNKRAKQKQFICWPLYGTFYIGLWHQICVEFDYFVAMFQCCLSKIVRLNAPLYCGETRVIIEVRPGVRVTSTPRSRTNKTANALLAYINFESPRTKISREFLHFKGDAESCDTCCGANPLLALRTTFYVVGSPRKSSGATTLTLVIHLVHPRPDNGSCCRVEVESMFVNVGVAGVCNLGVQEILLLEILWPETFGMT